MSFLDRFRRPRPAGLTPPRHSTEVMVPGLQIFTAETLVILTLPLNSLPPLRVALENATSLQLTAAGQRPVTFIPVDHDHALSSLDPDHGWLIPCSRATRAELLQLCTEARPGDHELDSVNLAVVLETP